MPRLLILCEYPTLLGGERSMLATMAAIVTAGFDVRVAAPPQGPLADAILAEQVPLVPWQVRDERGGRKPLRQLCEQLERLIARQRPTLIHANSLSMARIAGPVAAEAGVASLGHLRDIVKLSRQAVTKLNHHRRLIAVSRAVREFHVDQGVDADKCVVVNNGVDLEKFQPRKAAGYLHRELRLPNDARLIATIGQVGIRKATDTALAAAMQVVSAVPDIHWLIVGERTSDKAEAIEFERQLHLAASTSPLVGRVHIVGSRDDVPRIMCECTLLVHAARQEPLGRVLLEAAASGLAVVATDVGGTREIFPTQSEGALLVPPNDVNALADAVIDLLTDEPRRTILAARARRRAAAAFDIGLAAERLMEQYRAIISQ